MTDETMLHQEPVAVVVYQNADHTYSDEHGNDVYPDGDGGFVYADGYPVLLAEDDEPVIYEDGQGGYVDEFGVPAFLTESGHWVDADGYALVGRSYEAPTVAAPAAVSAPAPTSGRKRRDKYDDLAASDGCGARAILALCTVIAIVALVAGWYGWGIMKKIDPPGEPGAPVASVMIPKNTNRNELGVILAKAGIISDAGAWSWYTKLAQPVFNAGEYTAFKKNMSFDEAIEVLGQGPVPIETLSITFKEGITLAEAVGQFLTKFPQYKDTDFYNALASGAVKSKYLPNPAPALPPGFTAWEGLLFPSTYQFREDWTPAQLLQVLATEMEEKLDSFGYQDALSSTGYSPYQVLTFASMIEDETAAREERAMVARVMYNRIEAGDFLGIDATTRYSQRKMNGEPLTSEDFKDDDPYNTRRNVPDKIPPTPIGLPSEASLRAAINPAEGEWRWYVVDDDPETRTHIFCNTYEEFLAAKRAAERVGEL